MGVGGWGLEFGVQGLGLILLSGLALRFRMWGLGCGGWGLGFRVQGLGLRVEGLGPGSGV